MVPSCEFSKYPDKTLSIRPRWTHRTLAVHELVDSQFLVLPGSESTITKINEYIYFSLFKPCREFKYKNEQNTVSVNLFIEHIFFCEK